MKHLIEQFKAWVFGDSFGDGAEFAADNTESEIEGCIQAAKDAGQYGEFERGMAYHLEHRRRFPNT